MGVASFEGVVENGRIRLADDVRLPERTKVYVVVPEVEISQAARLATPRLKHREQAADFCMEMVEEAGPHLTWSEHQGSASAR
jgi:hypothetical protein